MTLDPELARFAAERADAQRRAGAARADRGAGAHTSTTSRSGAGSTSSSTRDRRDERQPGADHRPRADHPAARCRRCTASWTRRDMAEHATATTGASSSEIEVARPRHRRGGDAPPRQRLPHRLGEARLGLPPRDHSISPHTERCGGAALRVERAPVHAARRRDGLRQAAPRRSPVSSTRSATRASSGGEMLSVEFLTDASVDRARFCRRRWNRPTTPRVSAMVGRWQSNCVGDFFGGAIYVAARHDGRRRRVRAGDVHGQRRADDLRPRPVRRAEEDRRATLHRHGDAFRGWLERGGVRLIELQARAERGHRRLSTPRATTSTSRRGPPPTAHGLEEDAILTRAKFDVARHRLARGRRQRRPARHRPRPARRDPGPLGRQRDLPRVRPDRATARRSRPPRPTSSSPTTTAATTTGAPSTPSRPAWSRSPRPSDVDGPKSPDIDRFSAHQGEVTRTVAAGARRPAGRGRLGHGPGRLWPWPRRPGVRERSGHGSVTKTHGRSRFVPSFVTVRAPLARIP